MERYELAPGVTVHIHASGEGGIFANAYVVESPNALVAVDATLTETESKTLRREVEALGNRSLPYSSPILTRTTLPASQTSWRKTP